MSGIEKLTDADTRLKAYRPIAAHQETVALDRIVKAVVEADVNIVLFVIDSLVLS